MSVNKLVKEYKQLSLHVHVCVCMHNVFGLTSANPHNTSNLVAKCVIVNDCNQPCKKTQTPNPMALVPFFPSFRCMPPDNLFANGFANGHCLVQAQQNLLAGAGAGLRLEPLDQI